MAGDATQLVEQVDEVSLRFMVDRERNKVLYVEAGKDFVDTLFSFLIFPLGTIARLAAKESNIDAVKFGSLSSLYESVSDLGEEHLWNKTCKEMLLKPRVPMGLYYRKLKFNIDESEPLRKLLNQESFVNSLKGIEESGFVKETSTFIVSDDLCVLANEVGTSLNLCQKHGVNDIDTIDKRTVNISKKEVIDILKLSLVSKTPLTDFIYKKEQFVGNLDPRNRSEFWIREVDESSDEINDKMVVKVLRRKSNEQILFLEAQDDFIDFVFSFLTFPLGGVLHMLQGFSLLSCIDNLYKSMIELSSDGCIISENLKEKLTKPPIPMQFELRNQILPIDTKYKDYYTQYKFIDPKSPISGGYVKGPITFIVTDDMVVTPLSSIAVVSYLERMKVAFNDVEERVIRIGRKEGLSILKASLTTTSTLTNSLSLLWSNSRMNKGPSLSIQEHSLQEQWST
ncbi:uncharacterized protein [Medicago truncatula]|uniref:uncharacterized protein n=1 Tax=Medicago truncatula TaxID=3880 RepID=UPI001966F752|nr:uncharacterized protein LOC25482947 [Medicago truncatula]